MKVIYKDADCNTLLIEYWPENQIFVLEKGDRAMVPVCGVVTVIDRMYDTRSGDVFLTCERYGDGDGEDEA